MPNFRFEAEFQAVDGRHLTVVVRPVNPGDEEESAAFYDRELRRPSFALWLLTEAWGPLKYAHRLGQPIDELHLAVPEAAALFRQTAPLLESLDHHLNGYRQAYPSEAAFRQALAAMPLTEVAQQWLTKTEADYLVRKGAPLSAEHRFADGRATYPMQLVEVELPTSLAELDRFEPAAEARRAALEDLDCGNSLLEWRGSTRIDEGPSFQALRSGEGCTIRFQLAMPIWQAQLADLLELVKLRAAGLFYIHWPQHEAAFDAAAQQLTHHAEVAWAEQPRARSSPYSRFVGALTFDVTDPRLTQHLWSGQRVSY